MKKEAKWIQQRWDLARQYETGKYLRVFAELQWYTVESVSPGRKWIQGRTDRQWLAGRMNGLVNLRLNNCNEGNKNNNSTIVCEEIRL